MDKGPEGTEQTDEQVVREALEFYSRLNPVWAPPDQAKSALLAFSRIMIAFKDILSGIQTDSRQQVYITGDHFALRVETAKEHLDAR